MTPTLQAMLDRLAAQEKRIEALELLTNALQIRVRELERKP